jgi:hypothetical protein
MNVIQRLRCVFDFNWRLGRYRWPEVTKILPVKRIHRQINPLYPQNSLFSQNQIMFSRVFCALFSWTLLLSTTPLFASPKLPARVTWIGNSYPGGDGKHVPQDIDALCVTPDGRVFSNVFWEEGGGNVTEFKDGKVLGNAGHTHGWGHTGGKAIACNSKYLYIGCRMENEGGGLKDLSTWPPKGKTWLGISRRPLNDIRKAAPFAGAKGGAGGTLKGAFLIVAEVNDNDKVQDLPGIAADDKRLYVSCPADNTIKIYNAETMALIRTTKVKNPGWLTLDQEGTLLMVRDAPEDVRENDAVFTDENGEPLKKRATTQKSLAIFDRDEKAQENLTVGFEVNLSSLAAFPPGTFLIPDEGVEQRILRLTGEIGESPIIGQDFGIFSPPAGKFGDLRFNNLSAVASDANGNFYVAHRGSTGGGSTVLESYNSQNELNWRLFGLNFVDMADVDPADDTQIFTKEERFSYDYSKRGVAAWKYEAYTFSPYKNAHDPRQHISSAGAWVRRIGGKRVLFVNDMNAEHLQAYRFDGELAVFQALFAKRHLKNDDNWPPGQPAKGEWIWRDIYGAGAFQGDEYDSRETDAPSAQGWWVDSNGGVWLATEKSGLRYFPCEVKNGLPHWTYATMQTWPHAKEFSEVKRVRYDVKTDTLYLGGTKGKDKNQHWKPMGPVMARYDNWLKGDKKLRWQITAPYQKGSQGHSSAEPMGFDVAGDYIFVPYTGASKEMKWSTGHIEVFRAADGQSVGHMEPGADIGEIGLQDIRECLRAHQRKDGEYIVFLEDDYKAKILMYRWKP